MEEKLEQSIQRLQANIDKTSDYRAKSHQYALLQVGKFILAKGPFVKTRDAGNVYAQEKGLTDGNYSTIVVWNILQAPEHFTVVCIQAYLVQNIPGSNLDAVVNSLSHIID